MTRLVVTIALVFFQSMLSNVPMANAEETSSAGYAFGDDVPLDESDHQDITLQVLKENPVLSSSPGIKFAEATRARGSTDMAGVIFYPHVESAGIKQAFQVNCSRHEPDHSWKCDPVTLRRYLQLDSQDFEVRVKGDIGSVEALALIQATRETVQASATGNSITSKTAIMVYPDSVGYQVTWGSVEGYHEVTVYARLRDNGNPSIAEDWQAGIAEQKK